MNLADILTLAGLSQQEPSNSLSTPGASCNQHMNTDDMRTLIVKLERPQQPEEEMVATEEAEGSYANAPDENVALNDLGAGDHINADGNTIISIDAESVMDQAGNFNAETVTFTFRFDIALAYIQ